MGRHNGRSTHQYPAAGAAKIRGRQERVGSSRRQTRIHARRAQCAQRAAAFVPREGRLRRLVETVIRRAIICSRKSASLLRSGCAPVRGAGGEKLPSARHQYGSHDIDMSVVVAVVWRRNERRLLGLAGSRRAAVHRSNPRPVWRSMMHELPFGKAAITVIA